MSRSRSIFLSFALLASCHQAPKPTEVADPVPKTGQRPQNKTAVAENKIPEPPAPVLNDPTRPNGTRMYLPDPTQQLPTDSDLNPTVTHRPGSLTVSPPGESKPSPEKP